MMKIAVIYMGGTFGCIGQPLAPMPAQDFLQKLQQTVGVEHPHLSFFAAPSIKDSTELNATDWLQLSQLLQSLSAQFQHFIIIHGTDTLSYAAAFLHHIFKQKYHIIFTGSQYPLLTVDGLDHLADSDAWDNLQFSIQQMQQLQPGVYLAFHQQLHAAHQSYKCHTEHFNAFTSWQASSQPAHHNDLSNALNITPQIIEQSQKIRLVNYYLYPTTGQQLNTDIHHFTQNPPHMLILQGFGSGNIPYHVDLKNTLENLIQQGCWVIISSQVLYGALSQKYTTGSWLNSINVVFDPHYSQADLYARATLLYLQYGDQQNWQQYWA